MSRRPRRGLLAGVSTALALLAGTVANVFTTSWNIAVGAALAVLAVAWIAWEIRRAAAEAAEPGPEESRRTLVGEVPPLADCFQPRATAPGDAALTVLSGAGGSGKTQAAAAYAQRRWRDRTIDVLVWITAADRTAIVAAYARAAEATGISAGRDADEAALRFLNWLAATGRSWLVVLDDLTIPGDLTGLWPPRTPGGRVVITTRRRDASLRRSATIVEVGTFTAAEAHDYLRGKLGDSPERLTEAAGLADDLGRLPLALSQAAAYILDRDIDCAEYRVRFADRTRTLADIGPEPGSLPDDQHRTIATTWALSFQIAEELLPVGTSARLLAVLGVLDPHGVPAEALLADPVRDFVGGADLPDHLAMLRRLSLVDERAGDGLVRVHALIQRAARERTNGELLSAAASAAADGLLAAWPDEDAGDADLKMILYANTVALRATYEPALWRGAAHPIVLRACGALYDVGLRDAAGAYLRETLPIAWAHLGPDHPDTLKVRHQLAGWLGQSDPAGAVREHEPVLADRLRILGAGHEDTLSTRNNMLFWRGKAGDPEGAAAGFATLVADSARAIGPTHEGTLTARNNLAYWLTEIGRVDEARTIAELLVADSAHRFGERSPTTVRHRHMLALTKDAPAAVRDLEHLLPDCRDVFGAIHETTMVVRQDLARLSGETGNIRRAVRECRAVVEDRVRVLGETHPQTLGSRRELARWQAKAGDRAGAKATLVPLLRDQERVLGAGNPEIRATREMLSALGRSR